ncbi:coiled-coil and C2 domain-containing protein 1-like [Centruroides sculpturatus]|uniref:coiled-coil and C2 domain-containing protein 1-like n=1 Tax=Centruroides sculpturatus TaxID=218467 RepID=UPI000C6CB201|nr:coiled-coil and C2 domain-containing protein 1-like [Centruroides sculpturatus]
MAVSVSILHCQTTVLGYSDITLEGLIKSAKAGRAVNEEEIPPQVAIPKKKEPAKPNLKTNTITPDNSPLENKLGIQENTEKIENFKDSKAVTPEENDKIKNFVDTKIPTADPVENSEVTLLNQRKNQYKAAALHAKKAGDTQLAIKYVKIAKQFDNVITALESGQPVDLRNMPPPPPGYQENKAPIARSVEPPQNVPQVNENLQNLAMQMAEEPVDPSLFGAPPPPKTVMEALNQRLEKFRSTLETAKSEGNNSKVRRMGRIVKQYEDAIKQYKAGKPVDFEELATPPGFGPIPTEGAQKEATSVAPSRNAEPSPAARKPQAPPRRPAPAIPNRSPSDKANSAINTGRNPKLSARSTSFVLDKQLNFLLERQRLFKKAALESKNKGDIQQAKEYLRMSKGIEPMIEATRNGLPIDATSIPTPPQIQEDYVIVEKSECVAIGEGEDSEDLYSRLETDLVNQIEICQRNKDHFLKLGDVSSASKFEKLAHGSRKDLDVVKHLRKLGEPLPRFHYETRLFSIVQCNTDLSDTDFEISVERGINLPDEIDAFIQLLSKKTLCFSSSEAKGIEPMIEATRNGLPIDATSIPTPPQIQEDYVIVEKSECVAIGEGEDSEDLYSRLETDLVNQIEICQRNKDHFLKLGDVSSASKFEKLAHGSRKDLDVVKHLRKLGEPLPRFHYETRLFSIVQCNTDLSDTDFEISVERGINLPEEKRKHASDCSILFCIGKPTELDSFVKVEFPFPTDNPQKAKTHTVKDTNNPEYKETFKFKIDRKSRSLARIFKRQPVKIEVWSRGGFFRSDVLLGTLSIKLADLEKKCTIHDSFEIMDGRKSTGGKLEVKMGIRDPLLVKQVEEVRERWLVIGS